MKNPPGKLPYDSLGKHFDIIFLYTIFLSSLGLHIYFEDLFVCSHWYCVSKEQNNLLSLWGWPSGEIAQRWWWWWKIQIICLFMVTFQLFQALFRNVFKIFVKYGLFVYLKTYQRIFQLFNKIIYKNFYVMVICTQQVYSPYHLLLKYLYNQ